MGEESPIGFYETEIQLKPGVSCFVEIMPAFEDGLLGYKPLLVVNANSSVAPGGNSINYGGKEYIFQFSFTASENNHERRIHKGKLALIPSRSSLHHAESGRQINPDHDTFVALLSKVKAAIKRYEDGTPEWKKVSLLRALYAELDEEQERFEKWKAHMKTSETLLKSIGGQIRKMEDDEEMKDWIEVDPSEEEEG